MKTRIIETKAGYFIPQYRSKYFSIFSWRWKTSKHWTQFTVDQEQYDHGDLSWSHAVFNNMEDAAKFIAKLKEPKYTVVYES